MARVIQAAERADPFADLSDEGFALEVKRAHETTTLLLDEAKRRNIIVNQHPDGSLSITKTVNL